MNNKGNREWSGKSRGGALGHKFFVTIIRTFGVRPAYFFLSLNVIYFIPFAPKATKAIWRYNRRILKYGIFKSLLRLYIHYYTFGQTIIDKIAINSGMASRYKFEYENYNDFLGLLNQGETIIIGAHVGCWEIGSQFFGDYASRLNIVMYDAEYQKIKALVDRPDIKHKIIPINEGSLESLIQIKSALSKGEYVCMQGDRFLDRSSATILPFMGKDALFATGPTLVASKFKSPVVFYFAMREKGRKYRFIFKTVNGSYSHQELMSNYIAELESVVWKYPQQWFNFYDIWSTE